MVFWVLFVLLEQVLSIKEYGEYRLYQQTGGLIYDFSGNGFHGRNGNGIVDNSWAVKFTDRGAYLDGSKYFLVHSDEFGNGPVFSSYWSTSIWVYFISYGPLIYRRSNLLYTSFIFRLTSATNVSIESTDCNSSCSQYTEDLNFAYPLRTWILITLIVNGSTGIEFYQNYNLVHSYNTAAIYGDRDSFSLTYIGADTTGNASGFVYYIEFNSGAPNISRLVSTTNTGCNGFCYYNFISNSHCNCSNCPLVGSSKCISTCELDYYAGDCFTNTSGCSGIFTITSSGCTECPSDKWPVCDTDPNINLSSVVCHPHCKGCNGPTISDCLSCSFLYMTQDSGSCECPANSSPVGSECVCDSSYFMSSSGNVHTCVACSYPCAECSGSSSFCTACVQTGANPDTGVCSCPSNSSDNTSSCDCNQGYFLELVNNTYQCSTCDLPCLNCSGTSTSCTECSATFNLNAGSCECPSDSTLVSSQCQCDPGFYLENNTQYECVLCPSPCQECSAGPDICTACLSTFNLNGSSCQCPERASVVDSRCLCEPGFFLSLTSESSYECSECSYPCSECSTISSNCTNCAYTSANTENGNCVCPANSSLQTEECVCESEYIMVSNNGVYECLECPLNSQKKDSECECISGYLMITSDPLGECVKCKSSCKECSGSAEFCVSCSVENAILNEEEGACSCPSNSREFEGECVCEDGFELKNSRCEKSHTVDLEAFMSIESVCISAVIIILSVSTMLMTDPSSVWMILNTVQILSYIPLHSFKVPKMLETICNGFKLESLLPNLSVFLLGEDLNIEGLPESWVEQGINRTNFVLNLGQIMLILCGYICFFLAIVFLACVMKAKFLQHLSEFRYNIWLRLWVEIFMEVFVASLISFNQILIQNYEYMNLIGGAVFIFQIVTVFLLWKKLYNLKIKSEETNETIKKRFSCLFYEFDLQQSEDSYYYYIYFLIRRIAFILGLYYLSSSPFLQLLLSLNGSFFQVVLLFLNVKFQDLLNQATSIATEVVFCIIFISILYYNIEISEEEEPIIEYLSIGLASLIGLILIMNHLVKTYLGISEKCRKRNKHVIDESVVAPKILRQESLVFALPRHRNRNIPGISLNIEEIS